MLGTGSAFAKTYYNTNAMIYSENQTLLLDCGITAPLSLHQLGKPISDIDAVLISHIHADHIGGMEELAFRMKFNHGRKPLLFIPEPLAKPLWESSLKGGLLQDECPSLDDYFDVRLIQPDTKSELIPGLTVEPIQTAHIPNKISYSYFFNDTFFYSADMIFNSGLLQRLVDERGCTTIFHDCQLKPPGVVHTTLDELRSLPLYVQERIWLMHYDDTKPQYEGHTGVMRFVEQHERYRF
ncbi:ribonuclease Z [Paenibacillus rhizovicinus]|uniref:Ribonuclease Z n=2 Tax=Paenibacillus rhizovicinus TaxID=2704463 RepID=A0A6C0P8Q5_9BACL|nr:ribonuclease Z [Paenibacillus rhizovicinus]